MKKISWFTAWHVLALTTTVTAMLHPDCDIASEIRRAKKECLRRIREIGNSSVSGCNMTWENALCWPSAEHGETISVSCPAVFLYFSPVLDTRLNILLSLQVWYFITIQTIYTVGYSLSLIVLSIAVVILLIFRNLHCNRNYIHIQLFISFILRSLSVMIKDAVLFGNANTDHCDLSTVGCKVAVVFCYFSTMTNYFWLLVEALYLNLLLLVTFSYDRGYMWWWSLLGWGVPIVCTAAWVVTKLQFENTECWDVIEDSPYWWIVKGPIVASVAINLVLFVNIVRILVQKLIPRELHLANSLQYRRLMKSTMLLVPLFGIHYIVCAFPPNGAVLAIKLYLELCIGSFQGRGF
ncbi:growth hormone-releasing hormone receptor-like [Amblyraja radiata]|uniref:growth hormone-releasing hormone receptor-like n=1 Tax=Amblyraja radiata TaxID=386614 RepID=UPI0014041996|nr:growth hormone-releasing hormone receptor-like [Amblyraja radiata]